MKLAITRDCMHCPSILCSLVRITCARCCCSTFYFTIFFLWNPLEIQQRYTNSCSY